MSSNRTIWLINGRLVRSSVSGFWQIGNDPSIPNLPLESAGLPTITGTASLNDGNDALDAAGGPAINGSAAITDAADTLDAAGTVGDADQPPASLGGRDKLRRLWLQDLDTDAPQIVARATLRDDDDALQSTAAQWWRVLVARARLQDNDDGMRATGRPVVYLRPGGLVRYTPKAELVRARASAQ